MNPESATLHIDIPAEASAIDRAWEDPAPWLGESPQIERKPFAVSFDRAMRTSPGSVDIDWSDSPVSGIYSLPGNDSVFHRFLAADWLELALYNLRSFVLSGQPACTLQQPKDGKVTVQVTVSAGQEEVFRALSEAAQMDAWIAKGAKVDLRQGGEYSYNWEDEGAPVGPSKILELVPNELLRTDWHYTNEPETEVEWRVVAGPHGSTVLTLTHSGFLDTKDMDAYNGGWAAFLAKLRAHVQGESLVRTAS